METSNNNHNDRLKQLFEKIKNDNVSVRSKNYFRLKFAALIVVACLVLITSVFLFSFIFFNVRISGQYSFIGYGLNGLTVFLLIFPWKLLIIDIVFLAVFEYLLRSFRIGYKIPVLYLLVTLLCVIIVAGYVVDRFFPIHDRLFRQANQNHLPQPLQVFYKNAGKQLLPPGHNIFRGIVISVGTSTFDALIDNPREATTSVFTIVCPDPSVIQKVHIDEQVFISGPIKNGKIQAMRIDEVPAVR